MADDAVIGKRYPGYEFTIERGKVREFARGDDVGATPTTSTTRRR